MDTLTLDRVSPLHEACLGGHYVCAKFLVDNGANVCILFFFFYLQSCKLVHSFSYLILHTLITKDYLYFLFTLLNVKFLWVF